MKFSAQMRLLSFLNANLRKIDIDIREDKLKTA